MIRGDRPALAAKRRSLCPKKSRRSEPDRSARHGTCPRSWYRPCYGRRSYGLESNFTHLQFTKRLPKRTSRPLFQEGRNIPLQAGSSAGVGVLVYAMRESDEGDHGSVDEITKAVLKCFWQSRWLSSEEGRRSSGPNVAEDGLVAPNATKVNHRVRRPVCVCGCYVSGGLGWAAAAPVWPRGRQQSNRPGFAPAARVSDRGICWRRGAPSP
jgi:hypothetical protein